MSVLGSLLGTNNESFSSVGANKTRSIEGVSDGHRFRVTLDALALAEVKDEALTTLMKAITTVLQIGNLRLQSANLDSDTSALSTPKVLNDLASRQACCFRILRSPFQKEHSELTRRRTKFLSTWMLPLRLMTPSQRLSLIHI